ncbi:hypothetical protein, partial [Mycobacterium avium]|uniref:hypothetical protein n=1 Tax=Mycobacterium avium TaxID=1764 RepID=UPI001C531736
MMLAQAFLVTGQCAIGFETFVIGQTAARTRTGIAGPARATRTRPTRTRAASPVAAAVLGVQQLAQRFRRHRLPAMVPTGQLADRVTDRLSNIIARGLGRQLRHLRRLHPTHRRTTTHGHTHPHRRTAHR